ncbi:uncharacterized protein LOC129235653 [Anastrepha obliqua]|uniref:uncharacterized protein LOC129235653 n=1 Tax=Anastrepha obliqua TaxID=95512 RepID=UPI00240A8447|nr:uncharacterized protein LOC129235653 [Anastrepha obliqua]
MYGFLLFYFVADAAADNLGYNYQSLGHDAQIGGSLLGGSYANGNGANNHIGGVTTSTNSGFGRLFSTTDAGSMYDSSGGAGLSYHSGSIEYNKEFYSYVAPDNEFESDIGLEQLTGTMKKNLRVVFIKAPENQGLTNAVLQLAKQATDDRTAIYVLSKQPDIADLANTLQTLKSSNVNRPEVHFVKYRTPEDAAHAQQAIQAQYESLNGQSQYSNEGVAPVLDFASPASVPFARAVSNDVEGPSQNVGESVTKFDNSASNSYLPPSQILS